MISKFEIDSQNQRRYEKINANEFIFYVYVLIAFLLGGGTFRFAANLLIINIFAVLVIIYFMRKSLASFRDFYLEKGAVFAAILTVVIVLAQILPLPPEIWMQLPGRQPEVLIRTALSLESEWYPFSIAPLQTLLFLNGLIITLIAGYITLYQGTAAIRRFLWIIVGLGALTALIGVLQVSGYDSAFDFYNSGHRGFVTGVFSNRNHAALFVSYSMATIGYLAFTSRWTSERKVLAVTIGFITLFSAVIGTSSRAGVVLFAVASLYAFMLQISQTQKKNKIYMFFGGALLIFAASGILLTDKIQKVFERFEVAQTDLRWDIWDNSVEVADKVFPLGSGFGSFQAIFNRYEDISRLSPQYVNNAHNDFIEIAIESGLIGVAIAGYVLFILFKEIFAIASSEKEKFWLSTKSLSAVVLILTIFHSLVDYPVRRLSIAVPLIIFMVVLLRKRSVALRK